jgi:c(7)-type cytochrome triheme protein
MTLASHTNGKACFACHKKNGTAFYEECSGCHKDLLKKKSTLQGPGPLTYTMEGAGPVQFLHESHGAFACNECHPKSFAMKKGGSKMTMAGMYQGKSCGFCHDGKKAFASMQCAKCHKNN